MKKCLVLMRRFFDNLPKRYTGIILLIGLTMVLSLGLPDLLYAQDGGTGESKSLWDLIGAGGLVGWVIIICSVIALGLTIEHLINLKRDKLCPPDVVAELEALVDEGQYDDALALAQANPNFFTNIIGAALVKANEGYEEMTKAMEEAGEEESLKLQQKISYLNLIGMVTPMLGLLGTVLGMIGAFSVIEQLKSPSPAMLAKGIYEALVTTCMGLIVAIPALSVYFFFKNKITRFVIETGILCGEFIVRFKQK